MLTIIPGKKGRHISRLRLPYLRASTVPRANKHCPAHEQALARTRTRVILHVGCIYPPDETCISRLLASDILHVYAIQPFSPLYFLPVEKKRGVKYLEDMFQIDKRSDEK